MLRRYVISTVVANMQVICSRHSCADVDSHAASVERVTAGITQLLKASFIRSKLRLYMAQLFEQRQRQKTKYSNGSSASTIQIGDTLLWATSRQQNSNEETLLEVSQRAFHRRRRAEPYSAQPTPPVENSLFSTVNFSGTRSPCFPVVHRRRTQGQASNEHGSTGIQSF
jgi:hypothetical protein